jgi:uncharacterized membrane protein YeiB
LLLSLARKQGMIDGETVTRGVMMLIGLSLTAYGNIMPKMLNGTPRSIRDATVAQAVMRVGGWAMALGFLVWTALWAFAPQELASIGSMVAVGAGMAVMLGYTVWKYRTCFRTKA